MTRPALSLSARGERVHLISKLYITPVEKMG